MRAVEGPARTQQKQVLAEAREQGKFDAAPAIVADIERGPSQIAASIAELVETVAEDRAKLKAAIKSDNTKAAAEAERNIAFGETRAQMLNLLQNFCPYYANTDEGKKAVKAAKGKVLTEEMASSVVGYSLIAEIEKREAALKTKKREEDKALAETARKDKAAKAAQEKAAKQPTTTNKKQAKKAAAAAEAAAHAADAASAEADAAAARLAQAEAEAKAQAPEDAAPPTRNTRQKRK
jgi:colicin import membrane protein